MKHHYLWSYAQIVSIIFQLEKKRSSGKEKYSHKMKRKENLQENQGMKKKRRGKLLHVV